jgi:predicted transcriptional regulator
MAVSDASKDPNETRKLKIASFIESNPGVHMREITRQLELSMGVAQYHLYRLEKERTIVSRRKGFYRRYYANLKFGEKDQNILDVLSISTERDILFFLTRSPASSRELSDLVKLSPSTVNWHMKRLMDAGLVDVMRDGLQVKYFIKEGMTGPIVKLMMSYHPSVWQKLTDVLANVATDLSVADLNQEEDKRE